jgi:hypothetical protein
MQINVDFINLSKRKKTAVLQLYIQAHPYQVHAKFTYCLMWTTKAATYKYPICLNFLVEITFP